MRQTPDGTQMRWSRRGAETLLSEEVEASSWPGTAHLQPPGHWAKLCSALLSYQHV